MDSIIGGLSNFRVDTVLSAVDKYVPGAQNKIKNLADKAKAYVNNVTDLEMKVLEATNHEPWGPHGSVMAEITSSSFLSENFHQIMGVVDQRLAEGPDNWRLVYKTLLLLEYMLKHGPTSVAEALGSYSRLSHLERLRDRFEFKDPAGRDQGINVRQRAGAIAALLNDREKLKEERDKAAKNKSKYTGVSSSSARYGGYEGGSSSSSSRYGGFEGGSSSSSKYGGFEGGTSSAAYGGDSGSSSFNSGRRTSGRGAAAAAGGSSSSISEPADPVEATRQRIARLKADGAIAGGAASGSAADGGSSGGAALDGGLDSPGGNERKAKKLSDIKINPAISAMFVKSGLAPPPSSSSSAAANGSSGIDLLGDLDGPAPPAAAPAAAADEWDGFASAPAGAGVGPKAPAAAAADEWASFESAAGASSQQQQQQPKVDINSLLGGLPTTSPAASSGKAPLALDDFCSMPAAAPAPAMQSSGFSAAPAAPPMQPAAASAAAAADPFGPFVATDVVGGQVAAGGVGGFGDPFAASGVVHMVPQAHKQHAVTGPKLGPETAKAKDPFADLLM